MKGLFALLLLTAWQLNAQNIRVTATPEPKLKASTIYKVTDGYWFTWGTGPNGVGNYKTDTAFKPVSFAQWTKEFRKLLVSDLTPREIGTTFYQLGVKYDNKAFKLDFVFLKATDLIVVKSFHTEKYSWKEHGYYGKRYDYLVSKDRQKLLLVWQNPDVTSEYKVFEFDTAFNLLSEHKIETGVDADVKNYTNPFTTGDASGNRKTLSDVTTMLLDGKQNLLMITRSKKSRTVSIVKYSLAEKAITKKTFEIPEGFSPDFVSGLDIENNKLHLAYVVKEPEHQSPILDFSPFTINLKETVALLYTYDIEKVELTKTPIKLNDEEIQSLLEKGNLDAHMLGNFLKQYVVGGLGLSVLANGSCAVTVSISNIISDLANTIPNNIILRVYNKDGEQIAGKSLYCSRKNGDTSRFNINGNYYIFASINKPNVAPFKLSCYKIDYTGKVETYTYNGTEDMTIFRTDGNHTDKILATTWKGDELRILECK